MFATNVIKMGANITNKMTIRFKMETFVLTFKIEVMITDDVNFSAVIIVINTKFTVNNR